MTEIDIKVCLECGGEIVQSITFIVNTDQSTISLRSDEYDYRIFRCRNCSTEWSDPDDIWDDRKAKQEEADERESKGTVRNH